MVCLVPGTSPTQGKQARRTPDSSFSWRSAAVTLTEQLMAQGSMALKEARGFSQLQGSWMHLLQQHLPLLSVWHLPTSPPDSPRPLPTAQDPALSLSE